MKNHYSYRPKYLFDKVFGIWERREIAVPELNFSFSTMMERAEMRPKKSGGRARLSGQRR
jgi:hypothetical protein